MKNKLKKIFTIVFFIITFLPLLFGMNSCRNKSPKAKQKIDLLNDTSSTNAVKKNSYSSDSAGTASGGNFINPYYDQKTIEIKGFFRNAGNANVIFDELEIGNINPLESVVIDPDGSFTISSTINEPGLYELRFPNGNIHLFLRGGVVKVVGDISNLSHYEVTGSVESNQLRDMYYLLDKYNERTLKVQDRVDILSKDKTRTKELIRLLDSLNIYYDKIKKDKSYEMRQFITKLDTSMIAILSAFYLDVEINYDFLINTRNKFSKICPHSKYFKQLDEKISKVVPVTPGHSAPVLTVKDVSGKDISMNTFSGKNILIYFWASDDENSRRTNKKIKSVYEKYHNKGFEVYAIGLESSKDEWTRAIHEDQLPFTNVSNLVGRQDDVANIYSIPNIPYMFLIDRKGIIVDKGFSANDLELKLLQLK